MSIDDEQSKDGSEASDIAATSNFMPFQIRERMKVAPCVRVQLTKEQFDNFDKLFTSVDSSLSYVKELQQGKRKPLKGVRTWQKDEDDVVVVGMSRKIFNLFKQILIQNHFQDELDGVGEFIPTDDEAKIKSTLKAKLFAFHENRRPAYYGTWQKKSDNVKPRNPFAKDDVSLNSFVYFFIH